MIQITHLLFDAHSAKKVASSDMNTMSILVGACHSLVANATDEAMTVDHDINIVGDHEFYPAEERVDVNFLVLVNDGIAQVQTQPATKGVKSRPMECFTLIDVLVGAKPRITADAFAVFT